MVFSVKLSNTNPVSAWIGERLTLPGVVDFSCILFSCSVPVLFLFLIFYFSSFCHSAIILFAFVLLTPFPILRHVSDKILLSVER